MKKYEILKQLVKINTIKDKNNKEIIEYIEKYLLEIGFQTISKSKNLIMRIGENPNLGFLGHTDTVDIDKYWKTNPFELKVEEDKIYGLGVCDMKGGIAAMLEAVKKIDWTNMSKGLELYFTYDEETNFKGIKELLEKHKDFPNLIIFGEPTSNNNITGTKGLLALKVEFDGIKVHSSTPDKGISANLLAVKFLNELDCFYSDNIKKDFNGNYETPYTTMNIGIIKGGSEANSLSSYCEVTLDFRISDEIHMGKIKYELEELKKIYKCRYNIYIDVLPFQNEINFIKEFSTASYLTEASFIVDKNVKKIILGAGPVTAHQSNEYITTESYSKLVNQYIDIISYKCK